MNKRFIEFLIENDALEAYEENCIHLLLYWDPDIPISTAFLWCDTPEGYAYWARLNELWGQQCT
jgi:hypothetical protein